MFDPNAPEYFDLAQEYQARVKPLLDAILAECDALGIPAVIMFSTASQPMEGNVTRFGVLGAVLGHVYRMPTEMMLAASLLEPSFQNAISNLYRDYIELAIKNGFTAGMDTDSRTSFRAASAFIASRQAVSQAEDVLHKDVNAAERIIAMFAGQTLHDFTMNGGTTHG